MKFARELFVTSACLGATALAQTILPSNSSDVFPLTTYPRFNVNSAGSLSFPSFQIVPLAQYAMISRQYFLTLRSRGSLVETNSDNANQVRTRDISFVSCDPADYTGNIDSAGVIGLIASMNVRNSIVLYTRTGIYCDVSGIGNGYLPRANGIFTTVDPVVAGQIADLDFHRETGAFAYISPDVNTYTDSNAPFFNSGSMAYDAGSTTAVAMIVLYSITGIITALFVSIIVTGAIRAHLHPERYGPRAGSNARGGQSRAKGIARAVLETIPIVKFGDQHKETAKKEGDVEMMTPVSERKEVSSNEPKSPPTGVAESPTSDSAASPSNADGTDELGVLGCSICTEEFKRGEEVRVLPCNHKYHPDCVDPWLLNVSGTCPLCRVDLRGAEAEGGDNNTMVDPIMVIPASTSNMQALRSALTGTRDERIAALRRFRIERRRGETQQTPVQNEEERRGLARRLTDRFRIRTRQHGV